MKTTFKAVVALSYISNRDKKILLFHSHLNNPTFQCTDGTTKATSDTWSLNLTNNNRANNIGTYVSRN